MKAKRVHMICWDRPNTYLWRMMLVAPASVLLCNSASAQIPDTYYRDTTDSTAFPNWVSIEEIDRNPMVYAETLVDFVARVREVVEERGACVPAAGEDRTLDSYYIGASFEESLSKAQWVGLGEVVDMKIGVLSGGVLGTLFEVEIVEDLKATAKASSRLIFFPGVQSPSSLCIEPTFDQQYPELGQQILMALRAEFSENDWVLSWRSGVFVPIVDGKASLPPWELGAPTDLRSTDANDVFDWVISKVGEGR